MKIDLLKRKGFFFLSILFCVHFLLSCSSKPPEKRFKIGFSQCTNQNVWRQDMQKEINRELSLYPEIDFIEKDAKENSEKQIEQIHELIGAKIDLLIVCPNEAAPLTPIIDQVYKSGIPVIVIDRNTLTKNHTAFIGANNYLVGKTAGIYTNLLLKSKGTVLETSGFQTGSSADIGRHDGFVDYINKIPSINYLRFIGNWEIKQWDNDFSAFLHTHPEIDLIFAQNDRLALSIYNICKKSGLDKKIKIIGVDGLPGENGGIDLVAKGILKATILYPTGGKEAIQTAVNILEKKSYTKQNELTTTIIDSTNVIVMKLQDEKVLAQQEDIDRRQKKINEQAVLSENLFNIVITISITLALSLILGAILFYSLRENKKINRKLEIQKDEIAYQRNQLIELVNKLKEATNAKFNFFTTISHELRTPLTLILGPLEDALSSPKLHYSIKNNLVFIQRNSIRLLRIINQLMDFRKIEEGKMSIKATENNFVEFVNEIADSFKELARKKSISYNISFKVKEFKVWFDETMFDKVLFNLLSNAFKFTNDHGIINVSIEKSEDDNMAKVIIEDSGIGMSPDEIKHAFDLFYQGNGNTFKGTGLGLALSKEIIELHHGTIEIKSKKSKGSIFEIQLPLGYSHFKKEDLFGVKPVLINNYENVKFYITDIEQLNLQNGVEELSQKDTSILIIEDNDDLRSFLKTRLSNKYEIHEADNGIKGISIAFDIVPDLIISDIILPGQNGLQITETLKQDIRTSHIPVILLTAKGSMEEQILGIKSKADAFIVKPFNLEYLEETIKTTLNNRIVLRDHYTSELPIESRSNSSNKIDRKFINGFIAIVENNLTNEAFSIDDICKEIGVSKVQLYRKVKALIGYNVSDYILNVRMQKAKYLLTNELQLSISEVASKVGFSTQAYFATVFKTKFSLTPSEFREKKKKVIQ